ncbi:hypothetical protein JHK84_041468 [Glycine max]|nr:hypothetical protein JHK86_041260 [Glycine max]KAG4955488.1 hypothetical protein JHK85_041868 [Glycine max]KAG5115355.1 hypothetical protein JHK84_041468 [Glycine max]
MRRFLVDRASIENVNVVQQEAELEPPPNVCFGQVALNEYPPIQTCHQKTRLECMHLKP